MEKIQTIAEIGINHNGSVDIARVLIVSAAKAGCKYVKFQKRNPDICVPEEQKPIMKKTPWGEMTYLGYKHKIEFNEKEYDYINALCEEQQIDWFASVWDLESAEFMKKYSSIVKIPSALITNGDLLKYCRKNFEKVILSTGMSTEEQIEYAVNKGDPDIIFHSNSTYPSPLNELNLMYLMWLKEKYPSKEIGYSGHEEDIYTSLLVMPLGISYIEKHITLSKNFWGSDQKASIELKELYDMNALIKKYEVCLNGYEPRNIYPSEMEKLVSLRK